MLSFSLSTYTEGSFSLDCVNGKVAYSSSALRSMTIFGEDGEGVPSFRFFSTLTGLRLTVGVCSSNGLPTFSCYQ